MRARILKPGFFQNERLARLPARARLLFAGLWCLADREGRLEDRPDRIRAAVFPYERVRVADLLSQLEKAGFVKRYQSVAGSVLAVARFGIHQRPHPKEPESRLPAEPCNYTASSGNAGTDPSGSSRSGKDQDQDQTASPFLAFKRYKAIAYQAIDEEPTDDLGAIAERFKTICAKQRIPYNSRITQKAIDAARVTRARRQA